MTNPAWTLLAALVGGIIGAIIGTAVLGAISLGVL